MGNTWPTLDNRRLHMTGIGVNENRSWNNNRGEPPMIKKRSVELRKHQERRARESTHNVGSTCGTTLACQFYLRRGNPIDLLKVINYLTITVDPRK
jgi:hypothetical protein